MVTERHHSPEQRALWVISQIGTETVRQAALGVSGLTDLLPLTWKSREKVNSALLFHSFSFSSFFHAFTFPMQLWRSVRLRWGTKTEKVNMTIFLTQKKVFSSGHPNMVYGTSDLEKLTIKVSFIQKVTVEYKTKMKWSIEPLLSPFLCVLCPFCME